MRERRLFLNAVIYFLATYRSHSIFTVYFETRKFNASPDSLEFSLAGDSLLNSDKVNSELRLGKINFVDLAGMERQMIQHHRIDSGSTSTSAAKEIHHINLSLNALGIITSNLLLRLLIVLKQFFSLLPSLYFTLKHSAIDDQTNNYVSISAGTVLSCMARIPKSAAAKAVIINPTGKKASASTYGAIPYRDSKLTHYLKECFGGNALVLLLIHPFFGHYVMCFCEMFLDGIYRQYSLHGGLVPTNKHHIGIRHMGDERAEPLREKNHQHFTEQDLAASGRPGNAQDEVVVLFLFLFVQLIIAFLTCEFAYQNGD